MPLDLNTYEANVLREAMASPEVAVMRLAIEIDRQIRMVLASVGILNRYSGPNPVDAIDELAKVQGATVPAALRSTIAEFWQLRNVVVHSQQSQGLALRAVDYGLRILRALVTLPRPHYIVRASGVLLFQDAECLIQYPYGRGVLIQSYAGDGRDYGLHLHPSTLDYELGQDLSWEWSLGGATWAATWFRNPQRNNASELAWTASVEFRGRPIESV